MPTAAELDRIAPDHPVYLLHATCHLCSFNTRALEIVKLPLGLPGVDLAGGRPNGVVRDPGILTYVHPVMGRIMPAETKFGSLRKAAELALDKG
jgi:predicted amidohydrolase YtcJ